MVITDVVEAKSPIIRMALPNDMEISITKTQSIEGIEAILQELPDNSDEAVISFQVGAKSSDLLTKQLSFFLVSTLRQRVKVLKVKLFVKQLTLEVLKKDSLLFACVALADQVETKDGPTCNSGEELRAMLIAVAESRRKPGRKYDGTYYTNLSQRVIACDDFESELLPQLFYKKNGELTSAINFQQRLRMIWDPMRWSGSSETVEEISRILWELFENTDQHARVTRSPEIVKKSLRGCLLDYQSGGQLTAISGSHPLKRYLQDVREEGAAHFLFMTVFDSGIGIPDHRRPRIEIGEAKTDFELLADCFTHPKGELFNRSRGLPTVSNILNKMTISGAALIRSGGTAALLDKNGIRELATASGGRGGTCFSLVLPYGAEGFKRPK